MRPTKLNADYESMLRMAYVAQRSFFQSRSLYFRMMCLNSQLAETVIWLIWWERNLFAVMQFIVATKRYNLDRNLKRCQEVALPAA